MVSPAKRAISRIVFRVDASLEIGTGHVMRCLTLAEELRRRGSICEFICRAHDGHLGSLINQKGFSLHLLAKQGQRENTAGNGPLLAHAEWLGATWQKDAEEVRSALNQLQPDWLIVDHYALDACWEARVREGLPSTRLLVIDDLADRPHVADILLDQNLGRQATDYGDLVPVHCHLLIGPMYALLRDEFALWRDKSLARRQSEPQLEKLLISLGGVDKDNVTSKVLEALCYCSLPEYLQITVAMGATAPWLEDVTLIAQRMPRPTEVLVNITDMAKRMTEADLAIGAAGSTSWERCCLGLPTLMLVLAENQSDIAKALCHRGAASSLGLPEELFTLRDRWVILTQSEKLESQSAKSAALVDGQGVARLIRTLTN